MIRYPQQFLLLAVLLMFGLSTASFSRNTDAAKTHAPKPEKNEINLARKTGINGENSCSASDEKQTTQKPKRKKNNDNAKKIKREAPELPPRVININTATREELISLPGIGKTRADKIIAYRRTHGKFNSIDDVGSIDGIGPVTIEKIKNRIKFR